MQAIETIIEELIEEMELESEEHPDANTSVARISGDHGQWLWRCIWPDDESMVVSYSVMHFDVPEHRRHAVSEFITRANFGMLIGNFELDMEDGEVRYKTGLSLRDIELTCDMMRDLLMINLVTFDRYLPGLMAVVFGNALPDIAVATIEEPNLAADMDPYGRRAYLDDMADPSDN